MSVRPVVVSVRIPHQKRFDVIAPHDFVPVKRGAHPGGASASAGSPCKSPPVYRPEAVIQSAERAMRVSGTNAPPSLNQSRPSADDSFTPAAQSSMGLVG